MIKEKSKGLAIAGMVCGIVGIVFAWVPGVNYVGITLGVLAAIFGGVCIAKKQTNGQAIAGLVLGIVTVIAAIVINITAVKVVNTAVDAGKQAIEASNAASEINKATGNSTDEILGKDVEVTLGDFVISKDNYIISSKLPVTVKNLTDKATSFNIHIEAVDESGNRIEDGYVYASNLSAGQTQAFDAFTYVSSDKADAMKAAKFNIIQVQEF